MSTLPDPELVQVAPGVRAYVQPDGGWMVNNTGIVSGIGGDPRRGQRCRLPGRFSFTARSSHQR